MANSCPWVLICESNKFILPHCRGNSGPNLSLIMSTCTVGPRFHLYWLVYIVCTLLLSPFNTPYRTHISLFGQGIKNLHFIWSTSYGTRRSFFSKYDSCIILIDRNQDWFPVYTGCTLVFLYWPLNSRDRYGVTDFTYSISKESCFLRTFQTQVDFSVFWFNALVKARESELNETC